MRNALFMLLTLFLLSCGGCDDWGSRKRSRQFLMDQQTYNTIMYSIYDPDLYQFWSNGSGCGTNDVVFCSVIEPKKPETAIAWDMSEFDSYLKEKEVFYSSGCGGSKGMHWDRTWENDDRYIVLDAVWMKDGCLRVTYREILK